MSISNRHSIKRISLHPPNQPIVENILWLEDLFENHDEEIIQPILEKSMYLKYNTTENLLNNCITNPYFSQNSGKQDPFFVLASLDHLLGPDFQESCTIVNLEEDFQESFPLKIGRAHV